MKNKVVILLVAMLMAAPVFASTLSLEANTDSDVVQLLDGKKKKNKKKKDKAKKAKKPKKKSKEAIDEESDS